MSKNYMQRQFRYLVLKTDLTFGITFICPSCGAFVGHIDNVPLYDVADSVDKYIIEHECRLCPEGQFKYTPAALFNEILGIRFNASALRIFEDHHYLYEAYNNPCSSNICNCSKHSDFYLCIASEKKEYPFVCAVCSKLFADPFFINRYGGKDYKTLRAVQLNIFRDYFGIYYDYDGKCWREPQNAFNNRVVQITHK